MLQSIRDRTQGWIAGVIVSLLILSFALWGIHSYFVSSGNGNVVAKVNGVVVTKNQLNMTYERLRSQFQAQYSPNADLSERMDLTIKKQALQSLIEIQVLKQASENQQYRVSMNQVDDYLEHIPDFQVNGQFSINRFQQVLAATMLSAQEFIELIRTSLLIDQPRLGMIFSSFALPNEVATTYALIEQERDITYAVLPFATIAKEVAAISPEQIEAYYKAHEDEFRTVEQVSIAYLSVSLADIMATIKPTQDAILSFYNENTGSYSEPMRWKLEGILMPVPATLTEEKAKSFLDLSQQIDQKAKAGTDFATLMRENTMLKKVDNKMLANWVVLNQLPPEWQNALMGLNKAGQVSSIIKTNQGVVILKVIAFQDAKVIPFDKVKEKVKETYLHQQAEEKLAEYKEKLANMTYEHPESLDFAAKALGIPIHQSGLFTKEKGGNDLTANAKVRDIAFSHDVLDQQNNSDIIQVNSDTLVVLRVNKHQPAVVLSLNAVRSQVAEKLRTIAIEEKTRQVAADIKNKLQQGAPLGDIATQHSLSWSKVGFIGRHSNKVNPAIVNAAFEAPVPQNGKLAASIAKVANGYAVIAVNTIRDGVLDPSDKEHYKLFALQVQNADGVLEYELYKQSLVNSAKIVIQDK